jgi:DNA-directed RNA polymerase subunit H (RpoH/RPB5)
MLADRKFALDGLNTSLVYEVIKSNSNKQGFEITIDTRLKIIYYLSNKFKWSELKKFFDEETAYDLYILVVVDKISQNNLKQINALNINIQIFDIKELQFNITKHILVPKHEVVSDQEEIKTILQNYCLKSKFQLPHILKTDPVSRYLGLRNGDIVRITRTSPTAGEYIVYRCCM